MMQEAALGDLQQVKSSPAEVLLVDKIGVEQKNPSCHLWGQCVCVWGGGPVCSHRFSNQTRKHSQTSRSTLEVDV